MERTINLDHVIKIDLYKECEFSNTINKISIAFRSTDNTLTLKCFDTLEEAEKLMGFIRRTTQKFLNLNNIIQYPL